MMTGCPYNLDWRMHMFENRKVLYLTVIDSINGYIKSHNLQPGDQIPS